MEHKRVKTIKDIFDQLLRNISLTEGKESQEITVIVTSRKVY
jgi:hypothetical protein